MPRKRKSRPELKLSPVKVKWEPRPSLKQVENSIGYIYCVTELSTGKKYIGLKRFWFKTTTYHTKKPTKAETTRLNNYKDKGKVTKYREYKKALKAKYSGLRVRTKGYKESDWEYYVTSNEYLNGAIPKNPSNYKMEVLRCCETITELKALEGYMILDAYFNDDFNNYYNGNISVKLRLR